MVQPSVNEIFDRVNERKGASETWIKGLFIIFWILR